MLAVPAAWLTVALCSAVPLMLSQFQLSLTDAIFEVMSGLTTTGSTVIVGLDEAPRGLLLWRFLLVWSGGFGGVTIAVLENGKARGGARGCQAGGVAGGGVCIKKTK